MEESGFYQHIQQPTHAQGHTLDAVIITRKHSIAVSNINDPVLANNSGQCKLDHKANKQPRPEKNITFCRFNEIGEEVFNQDIHQLPIMQNQETDNIL